MGVILKRALTSELTKTVLIFTIEVLDVALDKHVHQLKGDKRRRWKRRQQRRI